MSKDKFVNEGGINGIGQGVVNTNSESYKAVRKMVAKKFVAQSEEQQTKVNILSLRFQMEDFLNDENPSEIIKVGSFLNELIKATQIKNKDFAEYIGIKPSNLSALLKGNRRINIELALKLNSIFHIHPILWLHIQNKNDLLGIREDTRSQFNKYSLDELLERRA